MGSRATWMTKHTRRRTTGRPRPGRARHSRLLHTLLAWTAKPSLAVLLITVDALWLAVSIAAGFPARPELVFHTVVDAVTLGLVFVIQHTASREQAVTQRKLDELLHALPGAEDNLIALEEASDEELHQATLRHRHTRNRSHTGTPRPDGARSHRRPPARRRV